VEALAEILSLCAEKRKVRYEDIELKEDLKAEALLLLERERLLLPSETSKSLAWEDRVLIPEAGREYEMPNVIVYLIKKAEESGEWNPNYAVERCLKEAGEKEAEKVLDLFNMVKEMSERGVVTPDILEKAAEKLSLISRIGTVIAELKGCGIISPCLREATKRGTLIYEVNPSLY